MTSDPIVFSARSILSAKVSQHLRAHRSVLSVNVFEIGQSEGSGRPRSSGVNSP